MKKQHQNKIKNLGTKITLEFADYQRELTGLKNEIKTQKEELAAKEAEIQHLLYEKDVERLVDEIKQERAQRLLEIEKIKVQSRQIQSLKEEISVVTRNALLTQHTTVEQDAEILALRMSLESSSKLAAVIEQDFMKSHKELEQEKLLNAKLERQVKDKTEEALLWMQRYDQAMRDLHVAQKELLQHVQQSTLKDRSLNRGYKPVVEDETTETMEKARSYFHSAQGKAASNGVVADRACVSFRRQLSTNDTIKETVDIGNTSLKNDFYSSAKSKKKEFFKQKEDDSSARKHGSTFIGYGLGLRKENVDVVHELSKTK